jgi:hypothetical protein
VGITKLAVRLTQTGFVATSRRVNVLAKVFAPLNESRGMREGFNFCSGKSDPLTAQGIPARVVGHGRNTVVRK